MSEYAESRKEYCCDLDDYITISENDLLSPKGRNQTTKSVICVFIKKHNEATPLVIN